MIMNHEMVPNNSAGDVRRRTRLCNGVRRSKAARVHSYGPVSK
jgi:hypothetical protein